MRDFKRIDRMISKIRGLWYENPDQRLCQLLCNLAGDIPGSETDPFYCEDDKLEEVINRRLKGDSHGKETKGT